MGLMDIKLTKHRDQSLGSGDRAPPRPLSPVPAQALVARTYSAPRGSIRLHQRNWLSRVMADAVTSRHVGVGGSADPSSESAGVSRDGPRTRGSGRECALQASLRAGVKPGELERAYSIKCRAHPEYPQLLGFKYMSASPFSQAVVRESRGASALKRRSGAGSGWRAGVSLRCSPTLSLCPLAVLGLALCRAGAQASCWTRIATGSA